MAPWCGDAKCEKQVNEERSGIPFTIRQVHRPGFGLRPSLLRAGMTGASVIAGGGRRLPGAVLFARGRATPSRLRRLVLIASFPVALGGGLTESLAILPLLVVLSAVARPVPAPSLRLSAASGLMLAVACLISLQAVPPAAVLFVAVVVRRDGFVPALKRGAAAVAGGVVLPIAIAGWLVARGAMGDALDQLLTFNAAYRNASSRAEDMSLVTVLLLVCLAIPAAITIGRMIRHPRAFDRIDWVCLAWTGLYALYIAYQGRIYLHYWIVIVPPVVWLAGLGAWPG
jgi:hypothetical protein